MPLPRLLILLIVITPIEGVYAASVTAQMPWLGWVKTGQSAEIQARVIVDSSGEYEITVSHGKTHHHRTLQFEGNTVTTEAFPIASMGEQDIHIKVESDKGMVASTEYSPRLLTTGVFLIVSDGSVTEMSDLPNANIVAINASELALQPSGYGPLDLLILDTTVVQSLPQPQRVAMSHYIAMCGRVVATKTSTYDYLSAQQNCVSSSAAAQRLKLAKTHNLAEAAQQILNTRLQSNLLPASLIKPLFGKNPKAELGNALLLACFAYIAALTAASLVPSQHTVWLLALGVSASIGLVWNQSGTHTRHIQWFETYSGNQHAEATHAMYILNSGRGEHALQVDHPTWLNSLTQYSQVDIIEDNSGSTTYAWQGPLLASYTAWYYSQSNVVAPLSLSWQNDAPKVHNTSKTQSRPASLAWDSKHYAVPALAPNMQWQPEVASAWPQSPPGQLFRQRAISEPYALFVEGSGSTDLDRFYFMVRP